LEEVSLNAWSTSVETGYFHLDFMLLILPQADTKRTWNLRRPNSNHCLCSFYL